MDYLTENASLSFLKQDWELTIQRTKANKHVGGNDTEEELSDVVGNKTSTFLYFILYSHMLGIG